jgi:hypothetical protein
MRTVLPATPDRTCPARHSLPLGPLSGILTSAVWGSRWRFIGVRPEEKGLQARCRMEVTTAAGPAFSIGQPGKERGDQASEGNHPRRLFDMDARCLGTVADPFTIAGELGSTLPGACFFASPMGLGAEGRDGVLPTELPGHFRRIRDRPPTGRGRDTPTPTVVGKGASAVPQSAGRCVQGVH